MSDNRTLERRALSLGTANAIDYALQFALPIVLTRALDAETFGAYRLLWLAASTLLTLSALYMPHSLYYFLPRSDAPTKRLYINQTLVFLTLSGSLAAWAVSLWNPFLPGAIAQLSAGSPVLVPAFVLAWIVAFLLDVLPTVDERVAWQARIIVGLSVVRSAMLAIVALVTHDFHALLWTMIAFVVLKIGLLAVYIARTHGLRGPLLRPRTFGGQILHAAPFGVAGTFFAWRAQADQWVAATIFPVTLFAAFSVATVLGPMVNLFRQSVNYVFLPSMSRMHSEGELRSVLAMNSRANAMVAMLVFPLLGFAFVFAEPLITLVYTPKYAAAAPVLRLYIVGLLAFVIELNSILLLLKQGGFSARLNACMLALSVPLSYWGATHIGLAGAALGSVLMLHVERFLALRRIAKVVGEPLASLQDWGKLFTLLGAAALSGAIAGVVANAWSLTGFGALLVGALCVAVAYPATLCLTGQRSLIQGFLHSLGAPVAAVPGNQ
jgi:O-antigen/teichoic acid export membrane protein